jgi:uncharacterized protein YPO0396
MTRTVLLLTVGLVALGGAAQAQTTVRDIQIRNANAQAVDDVRRDALAGQIDASNANERAKTQVILRDLNDQRNGTIPPRDEAARRDAELSASANRMERLTQDALDQSNARMRAIKPASQPN